MPKLSKAQLKRRGQLSWYNQLVKQGRSSDAAAWAERHRLFVVPPNDSNAHLNAAAQAAYGASVSTEVQGIAAARTTASPLAAYSGGAGLAMSAWLRIWIIPPIELKIRSCRLGG